MILALILILVIFGGGYWGNRASWGAGQYGGGLVGIVILLIVLRLLGVI